MKVCSVCKENKPLEKFSIVRRNEDGSVKYRNSWCNSCKTIKGREKNGVKERPEKKVTETHKECTKCHEVKPHTEYSVTKRNDLNEVKHTSSWCKACKHIADIKRNGRVKPVPKVFEDSKECLDCHEILHISKYSPAKRGRLGVAAYCKPCMVARLQKDPSYLEKHRAYAAKHREKHKERWRAKHRIHQFNRRSKIKATEDGSVDDMFVDFIYRLVICYWCKEEIPTENRTLEHLVELSQGGTHTRNNIRMACRSCNSARKGKLKCEQKFVESLESPQQ